MHPAATLENRAILRDFPRMWRAYRQLNNIESETGARVARLENVVDICYSVVMKPPTAQQDIYANVLHKLITFFTAFDRHRGESASFTFNLAPSVVRPPGRS